MVTTLKDYMTKTSKSLRFLVSVRRLLELILTEKNGVLRENTRNPSLTILNLRQNVDLPWRHEEEDFESGSRELAIKWWPNR